MRANVARSIGLFRSMPSTLAPIEPVSGVTLSFVIFVS